MERLENWVSQPTHARLARIVTVILAVLGMTLLYWDSASAVRLIIDGEAQMRRTHARTVASALQDWGIETTPNDRVYPDLESPISEEIHLDYAQPVVIQADGEWHFLVTAETYPLNILQEAGLGLFPGDRLWVDGLPLTDPTSQLTDTPARIFIQRGYRIRLETEAGTIILHSAAPTIGEALSPGACPWTIPRP